MENWRDQVLTAISQPDQPPYAPWLEDNEKPYYTDKPDWDAFGAMLLVAACHTYDEPVPPTVEKDWDFGEHPLITRLGSDEKRVWSLFHGATWWIPCQIPSCSMTGTQWKYSGIQYSRCPAQRAGTAQRTGVAGR